MNLGMGLGIRTRGKAGKFASAEQLGPELWPAWTSGLITVSGTGITVDTYGQFSKLSKYAPGYTAAPPVDPGVLNAYKYLSKCWYDYHPKQEIKK